MTLFADRAEAGRDLAEALAAWRGGDAMVVGIARGGVVVAAAAAEALGLELGAVVVRKLGSPAQREFALGAIAEGIRVVDPEMSRRQGVSPARLAAVEASERRELARRSAVYGVSRPVSGRTVIVVDDGVATGSTAIAACRSVRARGASSVVLAVPVAPATWSPDPADADVYVCAHPQSRFWSVGEFYTDFEQTTDAEVVEFLSHDLRG